MIVALAGGVGSARFLRGLLDVVDPREVTVIVNTGVVEAPWLASPERSKA